MREFLTFDMFIARNVLIVFYYIGAVSIPVTLYVFRKKSIERIGFFRRIHERLKMFYSSVSKERKTVFRLVFVTLFLCMELCWRILFEAMIGYFDMHDYLSRIANQVK